MMRIYIAGRYPRRDEFREYRVRLRQLGHSVTSRWLDEPYSLFGSTEEMPFGERKETALKDMYDIQSADALLFFAEDPYAQPPRGGRHVEFGIALAQGKKIFVVGCRENVFHYIAGIKHYDTFEDFVKHECEVG